MEDIVIDAIGPLLLIILGLSIAIYIEDESKREIEIIKKEETIYKYKHCKEIIGEYYCWDEIKEEEK